MPNLQFTILGSHEMNQGSILTAEVRDFLFPILYFFFAPNINMFLTFMTYDMFLYFENFQDWYLLISDFEEFLGHTCTKGNRLSRGDKDPLLPAKVGYLIQQTTKNWYFLKKSMLMISIHKLDVKLKASWLCPSRLLGTESCESRPSWEIIWRAFKIRVCPF